VIAALVILCIIVLAQLIGLGYLAQRNSDLVTIQANLAADRETLLLHSAVSKSHAEVAQLQRIAHQPDGLTPRQAARVADLETFKDQIRRTAAALGYDPDEMPENPEGLG